MKEKNKFWLLFLKNVGKYIHSQKKQVWHWDFKWAGLKLQAPLNQIIFDTLFDVDF